MTEDLMNKLLALKPDVEDLGGINWSWFQVPVEDFNAINKVLEENKQPPIGVTTDTTPRNEYRFRLHKFNDNQGAEYNSLLSKLASLADDSIAKRREDRQNKWVKQLKDNYYTNIAPGILEAKKDISSLFDKYGSSIADRFINDNTYGWQSKDEEDNYWDFVDTIGSTYGDSRWPRSFHTPRMEYNYVSDYTDKGILKPNAKARIPKDSEDYYVKYMTDDFIRNSDNGYIVAQALQQLIDEANNKLNPNVINGVKDIFQ